MHNISKTSRKSAVKTLLKACLTIILAFAACIIALPNFTKAFADEAQPNNRTVIASVFNFEGYHDRDADGRLSGYGIEFLNLVSKYSHLNFKYTGYDTDWNWDKDVNEDGNNDESILGMLNSGEIDVVTSVSRTAQRETECEFSLPIGRKKTVLSIRSDETRFERGNYATYKGDHTNEEGEKILLVGQLMGNSQNDILSAFAENKPDFNYDIVEYESTILLEEALQNGEIDAIISSNLRKTTNEKELDILDENDFYAVVKKGDPKGILAEINRAIRQMDIDEGDWQNTLFYKYYGPSYSSGLTFTQYEKDFIQKIANGEPIKVTALGDRAPYSYTENGVLKGIMPDYFAEVMELVAKTVGLSESTLYTFVSPDTADANVILDSMGDDDITEGDVKDCFKTTSYMTARMARVTRQDHKGGIKKVALADSQFENLLKREGYDVVSYTNGEEAMRAVLNNQADAAYVYSYSAQWYINHGHSDSLYYSSVNGMSTSFSMHIEENTDHELVTILNKCIKRMSDEELNQIVSNYTSFTIGDMTFGDYIKAHPEIIIVICFVLALIVGVIIVLYLRGWWNRKLLHTTEQSNKKMAEQLAIVEALSRDYTNVYAVNEESAKARIIKLEGYVADGLKKDSTEEYDYTSVLEKYIRSRVHPDDQQEMIDTLALDNVKEKLSTNDELMGSYRISDNGETHHYQYTYLKITDKDKGHGDFILVGFRNIDEVIRKEQEQKDILSEALAQAQYANKAKTTFLNNMSHDIRTPMNAIIGFTSLAVTHIDNTEQVKDYLGKIITSSNHLLSLINDVLDMSRIESGKVKIEEKETSLPDIMHDLKTIVQADVKSKQLEFYIDTLDVTNETIICDKLRLNQVLLNILSNAMKYTKPGGMVSVRVIQTAVAPEGYASYEFRVKDTGIGMSKEFLKHVFEPFEREQTSTVSGIQGTGLGLAITKNIVDLMGGTITVESEVGKGSEFIVKFRFRVTETPVEEQRLDQLENLRALVVDDDVNTCMSVSKMLSTIGMRPDWTTLGKEAVVRTKFAIDQREPYSAYIIDWLMPDMNGIELVRRIRKIIGKDTPIIILTAYDWTDIEKEAREAGVTAFCSKPLFLSGLRNVLAAPYVEKKPAEETEQEELRFDGKKLLLVEDNELNQEIAQTILETVGFVIDTADDGSVAVELMKKKPAGTYDLILMDVQMPIMNGYEATRAIRALKDPKKSSIPIVAMTANAFEEDRKEAMDSGMNGYAAKPIEIEKLMKTLQDLLK
ncbi:MAG: response regulator [Clostridia bacterium]|nr:response regulator [Clostridia bacterium]